MLDLKAAKSRQERLVLLLEDALLICKVRDKQTRNAKTIGRTRGKRNAPYKFKDFILVRCKLVDSCVRVSFCDLIG